jgi:hypothetical protein
MSLSIAAGNAPDSLWSDLLDGFEALMAKVDQLVARNSILERQLKDYSFDVS